MRFSRASLVGLAAGVAIFAAIVVVQALGSNGGPEPDEAPVAAASATATQPPTPGTRAPDDSPPAFIAPIDGGFVRAELSAGDVPEHPYGIVFTNVETGQGEYWRFAGAEDTQGEFYSVDPSHRWLRWEPRDDTSLYFGDRRTGATYEAVVGRLRVLLGPTPDGLVLLRSVAIENPIYTVIDLANDPTGLLIEFQLPSTEAFEQIPGNRTFLADGRALLFGDYHVDLGTGEVTELTAVPPPRFRETIAAADGGWVQLTPHEDAEEGGFQVQRFDAAGEAIDLDAAPAVRLISGGGSLSPDASWFYTGAFLGLESPAMTSVWPAIEMVDLQENDGFRVVRASPVSRRGAGAWLADSSGIVVATAGGFALLDTDGTLTTLPFGPVEQSGVAGVPVPVLAPHDPNLFLYEGRVLTSSAKEVWPAPAAAEWASTEPWNEQGFSPDGGELRFVQSPAPGRDVGLTVLTAFGLPARVEYPPFPDEVSVQVDTAGDTLNLRDFPSRDGQLLNQLRDGDLLTITNGSGEGEPAASTWPEEAGMEPDTFAWVYDVHWWVHVRTADGIEGWVRSEFVGWAD